MLSSTLDSRGDVKGLPWQEHQRPNNFKKPRESCSKRPESCLPRMGYADTSTEEIVRRSRVTRGALYYHYRDKADIFAAVFEEVRADSAQFIRGKMEEAEDAGADLWQQVIVGCHAFIESALTPSAQRIVHTDGPSVLDWPVVQRSGPGLTLYGRSSGSSWTRALLKGCRLAHWHMCSGGRFSRQGCTSLMQMTSRRPGRKRPNCWFVYWPDSGSECLPLIPIPVYRLVSVPSSHRA